MTTFIFTEAINAINSQTDAIRTFYDNSLIGKIDNYNDTKTNWKKDRISGKLSELSLQTSTYNKIIPLVYGTNKIAGNVIWLGNVNEIVNNNTTTIKIGKGQKVKQTSIEYFYYLSFAICICKGEIEEVKNVWADTTLLDLTKYTYRFYNGTDTQEPDSLIEATDGINNVSAYRELCYIVFENFPLSEFNNRMPNFLFEIKRKNDIYKDNEITLENCITGLAIAPSYGEYYLNTNIQYKAETQILEEYIDSDRGRWSKLNQNNNSNIADAVLSLQQMKNNFKNCNIVSVPVSFFGDSLDIKNCTLKPRVSFNTFSNGYPIYTKTDRYNIGKKWNRYNIPLIGKNLDGNFRFINGTSSDNSILSFFQKLKLENYTTIFSPKILMDTEGTPESNLLSGDIVNISSFFTKSNGYNEFVLHYATLLRDCVDVFLIGNNLEGLTKLHDANYNFITVNNLINLAQQVRNIVGNNVKISYGANYMEYHNSNNWYNLDKLWASQYIDFVGINAYFPLTNLPQDSITKDAIKENWFNGEGYDYISKNGIQNQIENKYAYKNIKYWWENYHINPNQIQTEWVPQSKKIWFTEYGFRSINATTNEPYKKYENPMYSNGSSDFFAQKIAIEATEEVFKNSIYIENKIVYCWDIRPYPFYPNKTDIWNDGLSWATNYCLNGKIGISDATTLICQLFKDVNLDLNLLGNIEIDEFVDGFVINNCISIKNALHILQKVYFFDCIESNGKINFLSNKNKFNILINEINNNELISNNGNIFIETNIANSNNLPKKLDLIFIDKNNNYDTTSVYAERNAINSNKRDIETLPIVLDIEKARNIAEISLYLSWLEKSLFTFILPFKYIFLEPSDLIKININNKSYILKIKIVNILENYTIKIQAIQYDNTIYDYTNTTILNPNIELLNIQCNTNLQIFEIPAINQDMLNKIHLFFSLNGDEKYWNGANLYYSDNNEKTYKTLSTVTENSSLATVMNLPIIAKPYYIDKINKLNIIFDNEINDELINNLTDLELFNGGNIAIYGNEIIQFKNIILTQNNYYEISDLIRGLFGTEDEINNHKVGDNFLILNQNVITQELEFDKINFKYYYNATTLNNSLLKSKNIFYKIVGQNLKPLKPCHVKIKNVNNELHLSWQSKNRGNTNWLDNIETTTVENQEKYCIEIIKNNKLIDKIYTNNKYYVYDLKNVELPIKINICQINNLYGKGQVFEYILN